MTSPASAPAWLGPTTSTAWHRLDPLTRLAIALGTLVAVVVSGGLLGPVLLGILAVGAPAVVAGVRARLMRTSLLLSAPLVVSAVIVNVLFSSSDGTEVLARLGPLAITRGGLELALEVAIRVMVMAGAAMLFYLTTRPSELVASLEAHGFPRRAIFVIHQAVAMVPRLAERAGQVTEAQRARGLDTEGPWWRRARGLLAVATPTLLGALAETEQRTLALEARAFTRPGPRTLLWVPADSVAQRIARLAIVAGVGLLVVARMAGWAPP